MEKKSTESPAAMSFRFKPETRQSIEALAKEMRLSKTGVIEFAVREMAKKRGVK